MIPKDLRRLHKWDVGQELEVVDTGDGLLLKAKPSRKPGSWNDVAGCLAHLTKARRAVTDEEMHDAVRLMAAERYRRSQKARKK